MGYVRVATVIPRVKPAATRDNADAIIHSFQDACEDGADFVLFPELAVTGYSCGDLFFQSQLLKSAEDEAMRIIDETSARSALMAFGLPLPRKGRLYNVAVVVRGGNSILGIVPKTYIPNSREYYENRWFTSGDEAQFDEVSFAGQKVPFGPNLLFQHENNRQASFAVEICEDLWVPVPPSSRHAMAGAQLIFNMSASNELVGKADYRRSLVSQQSARCLCSYVYVSAGTGESTTDTVFGGHALIAENGCILSESRRFQTESDMILADVDTELLDHERRVSQTFGVASQKELKDRPYRSIYFSGRVQKNNTDHGPELRPVNPHPFVPANPDEREARCHEISVIQLTGLAVRMEHAGITNAVIGLSGGLDSTLALLVTLQAFQSLSYPLEGIHAITMPGFGTSSRTLNNVKKLCTGLGLSLKTIDIRDTCTAQMKELGHSGKPVDIAYENIQARYRMAILMNQANMLNGLVVGTGDLSELALGWCTYNGDHMSMYAVNAGVPKTLVKYLINWAAENWASPEVKPILQDILDTPVSPELLPPDDNGEIVQKTEETIGPYELHDFFLFHCIRHGFGPVKILRMAERAFVDVYDTQTLMKWLGSFYRRFFSQQFKRSCMPDGPKVGTLALSPRGDWRMPSDADVQLWLKELESYSP